MAAPGFGSAAGLSSQAGGMPPTSPRVPGTMCSVSVCGEGKTGDVPSRGQSSGLLPGEAEWEPENPVSMGAERDELRVVKPCSAPHSIRVASLPSGDLSEPVLFICKMGSRMLY